MVNRCTVKANLSDGICNPGAAITRNQNWHTLTNAAQHSTLPARVQLHPLHMIYLILMVALLL